MGKSSCSPSASPMLLDTQLRGLCVHNPDRSAGGSLPDRLRGLSASQTWSSSVSPHLPHSEPSTQDVGPQRRVMPWRPPFPTTPSSCRPMPLALSDSPSAKIGPGAFPFPPRTLAWLSWAQTPLRPTHRLSVLPRPGRPGVPGSSRIPAGARRPRAPLFPSCSLEGKTDRCRNQGHQLPTGEAAAGGQAFW